MAAPDFRMPAGMKLGPVSLTIQDLDAMLRFYANDLGLKASSHSGDVVELRTSESARDPLIILRRNSEAARPPPDAAGLYHYAILLPDRKSLASAYLSLGNSGVVFDGYSDHLVSEALYLTDPESNGIEIYADRPREKWKSDENGHVQMATKPLDIDSLLKSLSGTQDHRSSTIPEGARIGHVHLKVTNLDQSITFYRDGLGLDLMSYWGSAAFLSAGQYHHHIGVNTWESLGGPPVTKGSTGLNFFTITVPEDSLGMLSSRFLGTPFLHGQDSGRLFVSDPDGIEMVITPS